MQLHDGTSSSGNAVSWRVKQIVAQPKPSVEALLVPEPPAGGKMLDNQTTFVIITASSH
jgi:hypothetical protein